MIFANDVSREPRKVKARDFPLQNLGPSGLISAAQVVVLDEAAVIIVVDDAPRDH